MGSNYCRITGNPEVRRLVSVPHLEIEERLEAGKAEKAEKKAAPPRKAGQKATA